MYDTNELLPVVARLTKRYTGIESSSVTYEKANQLMGGSDLLHSGNRKR